MSLEAKNVMCELYEKYCYSKQREQIIEVMFVAIPRVRGIIQELIDNGYISYIEKMGQTRFRVYIQDKLIEYYEQ